MSSLMSDLLFYIGLPFAYIIAGAIITAVFIAYDYIDGDIIDMIGGTLVWPLLLITWAMEYTIVPMVKWLVKVIKSFKKGE